MVEVNNFKERNKRKDGRATNQNENQIKPQNFIIYRDIYTVKLVQMGFIKY